MSREASPTRSIALHAAKDSPHEDSRSQVADGPADDAQAHTHHQSLSEVKARLEQPIHFCLGHEEVDRIEEDISCNRGGGPENSPRPPVVFRVEEEVGDDDADTGCDDQHDGENQQDESVDVVELIVPERGEDEIHLDEDAPEGEQAAQRDEDREVQVPPLVWDLPGDQRDPRRRLVRPREVPAYDRPEEHEGEGDEQPDEEEDEHRAEGDRGKRAVGYGDKVQRQRHEHAEAAVAAGSEHHRLDPRISFALHVKLPAHVPSSEGGERVHYHSRGRHCSSADVERANDRQDGRAVDHQDQLNSRPYEPAEEGIVRRKAEHVPLHLLPTRVLLTFSERFLLVEVLRVLVEVALESSHQDQTDKPHQEDDHHEGVEDGKPVDLVLEEVLVEVPVESL
mmetsp:Transcript_21215/g.47843  ORF Transcript_21215/g.47843 Transcript_21215/m.47843 type:complete len:395 (-) Transcript_21215:737-1921(-)